MEQTVKERLIQFIKYKGLSQRKFEIEVGLSNGYINNIRNGIGASVLQKLLGKFPDLSQNWLINGMIKVSREVGEKVTFYSARHSWATIAVNDVGIDKYVVHLALNHTDAATAITDTYIRKDFSVIDKANERVLDFVKLL